MAGGIRTSSAKGFILTRTPAGGIRSPSYAVRSIRLFDIYSGTGIPSNVSRLGATLANEPSC